MVDLCQEAVQVLGAADWLPPADRAKWQTATLERISTDEYDTRTRAKAAANEKPEPKIAQRPRFHGLDTSLADRLGLDLPPWQEALCLYLRNDYDAKLS